MYGDPLFVRNMIPARLSVAMERSKRFKESVNRLSIESSGHKLQWYIGPNGYKPYIVTYKVLFNITWIFYWDFWTVQN